MTTIENQVVKGITVKNVIVTMISTVSIVAAIMGTYSQLRSDISDVRYKQETQERINEIRLKVLEGQVATLQVEVANIKNK